MAASASHAASTLVKVAETHQNALAWSPPGKGDYSTYAQRLPPFPKTGNKQLDNDNESRRVTFMSMIDILMEKPQHIWPMMSELEKRLREDAKMSNIISAETFKSLSTFGKMDEDFLSSVVLAHSDLNIPDLVSAKQVDDRAIMQLAQYTLQWPSSLKFPDEMQVNEVAKRVCSKRCTDLGSPLKSWKKDGGLGKDGSLNWIHGAYRLEFSNAGLLASIQHFAGDKVSVPAGLHLSNSYTLHTNWDEWGAQLQNPPMPPVMLCQFFKQDKKGPFSRKKLVSSCKDYAQTVRSIFAVWEQEVQRANSTVNETAEVKDSLKEVELKKRRTIMDKARANAEDKQQDTKKRRTIFLNRQAPKKDDA